MNKNILLPIIATGAGVVALVVAAGASKTGYQLLQPAGTIASDEHRLMVFALTLSLIVVIPVFVMMFGFAWKYRETNTKARYAPDWSGSRLAESVWWGVPLILVVTLSFVTWRSSHELDPFRALVSNKKPLTVQVVALEWKWLFIYPDQNLASVNFLQLPKDTPINFAELVFPKLPLKATTGTNRGPAKNAGPFGEVIANVVPPSHRKIAAAS